MWVSDTREHFCKREKKKKNKREKIREEEEQLGQPASILKTLEILLIDSLFEYNILI